ncbi:Uu.00g118180.m01.CDS01 [Anthostomella pinea]|uniref:Uu.00g118180.m01.CDS01 n=1 Tax=Anthostomella pinea TaxID=933095 RepID=A0AAI8YH00_9PEZI|nr:Uu.00g118180.m01.CDS01 [Anthostomella pinea]
MNFNNFGDSLHMALKSQEEIVRSGISSVHEAIMTMSSVSSPDTRAMLDMVRDIKGLLIDTSSRKNGHSTEIVGGSASPQSDISADDGLTQSIERLSGLIHEKDRAVDTFADADPQAENIIQDLRAILDSAWKQGHIIRQIRDVSAGLTNSTINQIEARSELQRSGRDFGQLELVVNPRSQSAQKRPHVRITHKSHTHTALDIPLSTVSHRVSLRLAWHPDSVGYFAHINEFKCADGLPPFLRVCSNEDKGYTKDALGALLDSGADIHARDHHGETCLHLCLYNLNVTYSAASNGGDYSAIKFLVEKGADVNARNAADEHPRILSIQ